jgi:glutathione S-transferase
MKLYGHPWSINTRKTLMTLAEKGHQAELVLIMIPKGEQKSIEHLARHPFGKVPVLDDDGFVLYETRAINRYLDQKLGGTALIPGDDRDAARVEQWMNIADSYFIPHAHPLREMVLLLAKALDVPLREQNALLLAAGFAPLHRETKLDAPELGRVRVALDAILAQQEPFPAVVMNRCWDVLATNRAAQRFFTLLLGSSRASEPANVIRMMFHPSGLRPFVDNWESVAEALVRRMSREAVGGVRDDATSRLLEEILAYPGVPRRLRKPNVETALVPVLPVRFTKDGKTFNYFSTVTTLGTPLDVTLEEIRIECFFPVDATTDRLARELVD